MTDGQLDGQGDATGAVSVVSTAAFAGAQQAVAQVRVTHAVLAVVYTTSTNPQPSLQSCHSCTSSSSVLKLLTGTLISLHTVTFTQCSFEICSKLDRSRLNSWLEGIQLCVALSPLVLLSLAHLSLFFWISVLSFIEAQHHMWLLHANPPGWHLPIKAY